MRLVGRNRTGHHFETVALLDATEADALRRLWAGLGPGEDHLLQTADAALSRIRAVGAWIACDCLGSQCEDPPILFPRKLPDGRHVLVRASDRASHDIGCTFFWEEGSLPGHADGRHSAIVSQSQPDFLLYRPRRLRKLGPISKEGAGHDSDYQGLDPLGRRLFWLVERAGLNTFSGAAAPLATQYAAIRRAAEGLKIVPGVPLSEVLWTHPKWITEGWAAARLKKLAEGPWPKELPLQGYLLSLFDEGAAKTLTTGAIRIPVEGRLRVFASDGLTASQPYIALASVRHEHDEDRCVLGRAYAHPCLRDTLIPVDSDLERKTARTLAWIARKAAGDYGLTAVVRKPLFDRCFGDAEAVRPDFEVLVQDHVLVVETVNSDDNDFSGDGARARAVMRQIGPVYEDERGAGVDDKAAGRKLAKFVFGWMRAVGALPQQAQANSERTSARCSSSDGESTALAPG